MHYRTDDLRIKTIRALDPPERLLEELPCSDLASQTVVLGRRGLCEILHGRDRRLVVVVGPCSIHDVEATMEYASRLAQTREELKGSLEIVMRVYFEKPRTTVGWKGLINDPGLDGSFRINDGLRSARRLMLGISELGLPAGTEFLDMITPQYIADAVAWGAIGARTTESQVHRELASGLSCPVGFKNGTDGNIQIAVDAALAAGQPHHFLGVTKGGVSAIVATNGNPDCHVILRGGTRPNYDTPTLRETCSALADKGLPNRVMIDASHANSGRRYDLQIPICAELGSRIANGDTSIMGIMIESNLVEGRQDFASGKSLVHGQSITDACIGWDQTVQVLEQLAQAVDASLGDGNRVQA